MSQESELNIQMVDLKSQYERLKASIDKALFETIDSTAFIKGPALQEFEKNLSLYMNCTASIGVANGTDALQIALMALDLKSGDEVIVPAFTYVSTAEVIGLLGLTPVMVDVDYNTFNIDCHSLEQAITDKTRVIVPVHLFGQAADMEHIEKIAHKHNLFIVEDAAQAIGTEYTYSDGSTKKVGTLGNIGCTSFFPSKNLGCFGDGGAMFTQSTELSQKIRTIANHGQVQKYVHTTLGVNSRLDTIQAAVLNVKLEHLDDFVQRRQHVAQVYNESFQNLDDIITPQKEQFSTHVYHQYTLKVVDGRRDELKAYLQFNGIPSMVYYPIPLYEQEAYKQYYVGGKLKNTERLTKEVLSLPMHTEMTPQMQEYIIKTVLYFFR